MTEEIIIDVSNCPHKSDDDCMEVPICNEYGDLMGYQSCEAQTLCPYRSQKKIERLEQENKELKEEKQAIKSYLGIESKTILERLEELDEWKHNDKLLLWKYRSALEEIRNLCNKGAGVYTNAKVVGLINEVLNEQNSK